MSQFQIDDTDRRILSLLAQNARLPFLEVARVCGISGAAIHQRVRKLEENGVITGSRLTVKPSLVGLQVCVYINITISEADKYKEVVDALKSIPEVVECHFVTGKSSLLIKAYCKDNDHLINILIKKIQNIPHIQSTETMIALDTAFERPVLIQY